VRSPSRRTMSRLLRVFTTLAVCCTTADGFAMGAGPLHPQFTKTVRPATAVSAPVVAMLPAQTLQAVALNSGLAVLGTAKGQKALTPAGLVHAWALGVMLWGSLGWRGWSTGVLYLVGGAAVTKVKKAKKESMGIAEGRGGMRGPENVWGSAATAAVCALATVAYPARAKLLRLGFVASLATKLSDTFASEIGKAYGKTTYMITTLRPCKPGDEGGVSLEGTLAGVVGSIIITAHGLACSLISASAVAPSLVAAFLATNIESLIGASAQGRFAWLTNEVVNFIMTVIGAALAMGFGLALGIA